MRAAQRLAVTRARRTPNNQDQLLMSASMCASKVRRARTALSTLAARTLPAQKGACWRSKMNGAPRVLGAGFLRSWFHGAQCKRCQHEAFSSRSWQHFERTPVWGMAAMRAPSRIYSITIVRRLQVAICALPNRLALARFGSPTWRRLGSLPGTSKD